MYKLGNYLSILKNNHLISFGNRKQACNSYLIDASYYFSTGHIHNFELLKKTKTNVNALV